MKLNFTKYGIIGGLPALLLLTACVDDQYDLSNIDTSSRLSVNDLVLPVNIDPIELGSIIKIDADSKVQNVTIDGQEFYALVQNGEFESEAISINGVSASPSPISPTVEPISRLMNSESTMRRIPSGEYVYEIKNVGNPFSYAAANIDDAIISFDSFKTKPFTFSLTLQIQDDKKAIKSLTFEELEIAAPKGLVAVPSIGEYEPSTGIWTIPAVDVNGNEKEVSLKVTGIDAKQAGISILSDRSLDFKSQMIIENGYVNIIPNDMMALDDQVTLVISYGLDTFDITEFSGTIHYDLDGLDIDPILLEDLPKFLRGEQNNISIANPQIYLQLNNPVAEVPLYCSTGLELEAIRWNLPTLTYTLNNPIELGPGSSNTEFQNFVLSPSDSNLEVPAAYQSNIKWQKFSDLSNLLATPSDWTDRGLPNKINVELVNPSVPTQDVKDFALPNSFPKVKGNYEIMAPLALNDGSFIYYTDTRTGWNDEDVDKITVTALELTAHAVNHVPASVQLTVYPLDVNGNVISGTEIESNLIPAYADTDLKIVMKGEIRHLDGIRIEAVLESGDDSTPLSKNQTLNLTDIRAKVTGYYDTDF